MAINFMCRCGEHYSYPDSEAGTLGRCASCKSVIEIPMAFFIPGGPRPTDAPAPIAPAPKPEVKKVGRYVNGLERGRTAVIVVAAVSGGAVGWLTIYNAYQEQQKTAKKAARPDPRVNLTDKPTTPPVQVLAPAGSLAKMATAPTAPPPTLQPQYTLSPPPPTLKPPEPPAEPKDLSDGEIITKLEPSVAVIRGFDSHGAGFVVDPGLVVTSAHLIRRSLPTAITVSFPAGPAVGPGPVEVLYFDDDQDLAILGVPVQTPPISIATDYVLRPEADVIYIGGPLINTRLMKNSFARGTLVTVLNLDDQSYYQLSGTVAPTQSGAAVIDSRARVVAILASKGSGENMSLCIPASHLAEPVKLARKPDEVVKSKKWHEITVRLASMVVPDGNGFKVDGGADRTLKDFIRSTNPPTWMASVDAKEYCRNTDPRVVPVRDRYNRAKLFYSEVDKPFAAATIHFVTKIRDAGMYSTCESFLDAAATWAPEIVLKAMKNRSIQAFGDAYVNLRVNARLGHREAIARMRDNPATLPPGLIGAPPAAPKTKGPALAEARFQEAQGLYDVGKRTAAIAAFQAIVKDFPGTPQSVLAQLRLNYLIPKSTPPVNSNPGRTAPRG